MSSSRDAGVGPLAETPDRRAPTWPRFAVIAAVLVLAFVVSRGQDSGISQEDAVATATEQVEFVPEDTQVRFLRQGIDRHPFWVVSLSVPAAGGGSYAELAVFRIDADTGEIVEFREQKDAERGSDQAP